MSSVKHARTSATIMEYQPFHVTAATSPAGVTGATPVGNCVATSTSTAITGGTTTAMTVGSATNIVKGQKLYIYNSVGPTKDGVSNSSVASGASLTWSHTVGSQVNMCLVVAVAVGGSGTCTGVTYAGAAMTQLTSKVQGTQTNYIFYKLAPATGANNVIASFSGTVAGIGLGVSYYNVNQTTPFGTPATSSGTSGNSSNTVTTTSTQQLVLDINFANGTSTTAGSSQNVETSNTAVSPFSFADIAATGSNMSLSWTNAGTVTIWIEMSVAMNTSGPVSEFFMVASIVGTTVTATAALANSYYGTSYIGSNTGTLLGPLVVNKSGDSACVLTLYNGNPNIAGATGLSNKYGSVVAVITNPVASGNYNYGSLLDFGLFYTLAFTTAPDLTIQFDDAQQALAL